MKNKITSASPILGLYRGNQNATALINLVNPTFRYMVRMSLKSNESNFIPDSLEYTEGCIRKGIRWLLYHQDLQPDGGLTSTITFSRGRARIGASYPKITGYIIPTWFDYSSIFQSSQAFNAAIKASNFELTLQHPEGWFAGGMLGNTTDPPVFNSAQIVHSLVRTYKETHEVKYIDSAIKACRWIISVQEDKGAWGKFNYLGMKRTYDTKVCQALLEADQAACSDQFRRSVERNLDWILSNQKDNGWFYNCDTSLEKNNTPLTHTIGYTIQGLLACFNLTHKESLLSAATKPLHILMHKYETERKPLASRFFSDWTPAVKSSCVTGDAQISLCWMDLYRTTNDLRYLNAALKMNDFLKRIQYNCNYKVIDGSFPGSIPLWGDYWAYSINSCGVKYCVDALIKEYRIKKEFIKEIG